MLLTASELSACGIAFTEIQGYSSFFRLPVALPSPTREVTGGLFFKKEDGMKCGACEKPIETESVLFDNVYCQQCYEDILANSEDPIINISDKELETK